MGERDLGELGHRVADSAREHVVVRLVLLEHQPRPLHDVSRERPVANRAQVAEHDVVGQTELDRGGRVRDLPRDEVLGATL